MNFIQATKLDGTVLIIPWITIILSNNGNFISLRERFIVNTRSLGLPRQLTDKKVGNTFNFSYIGSLFNPNIPIPERGLLSEQLRKDRAEDNQSITSGCSHT